LNRINWTVFFLFLAVIVGLNAFRLFLVNNELVYNHSWGEAIYAHWTRGWIEEGLFWGWRYYDNKYYGFPNYVPFASMFSLGTYHVFGSESFVLWGRALSYTASLGAQVLFYFSLQRLGARPLLAAGAVILLFFNPLVVWHTMSFYNEPLSFLIQATLLYRYLKGRSELQSYRRDLVDFALIVVWGLLKPTNLVGPGLYVIFRFVLVPDVSTLRELRSYIAGGTFVFLFVVANRLIPIPDSALIGVDRWIWSIDNPKQVLARVMDGLKLEMGALYYLAVPAAIYASAKVKDPTNLFLLSHLVGASIVCIIFAPGMIIHKYYALPICIPIAACVVQLVNELKLPGRWALAVSSFIGFLPLLWVLEVQKRLSPEFPVEGPAAVRYLREVATGKPCYAHVSAPVPIHDYYIWRACDFYLDEPAFWKRVEKSLQAKQSFTSLIWVQNSQHGFRPDPACSITKFGGTHEVLQCSFGSARGASIR
jgi:hypothetical protein